MGHVPVFLSVLIVLRNQADHIAAVAEEISRSIAPLVGDYELLIIDNASNDHSISVLRQLTGEMGLPNLQVYALTKEVDVDTAAWVGLENALGDFVAVLDPFADDVAFLPEMLAAAVGGADVVFATNTQHATDGFAYVWPPNTLTVRAAAPTTPADAPMRRWSRCGECSWRSAQTPLFAPLAHRLVYENNLTFCTKERSDDPQGACRDPKLACTPASGWEKGQVENQVGNLRDQLFRPKPRVSSLDELNGWLEDQCIAYAKRTKHPEFKDRTIWEVFEEERPSLMERRAPFDGFVEKAVRATTTCLITADHNRYSVDARAAGRMVLVRSYAERLVVLLDEVVVANHLRSFKRDQVIYDPWHYLPVLLKKPGALRNGAPFKDWGLPPALAQVRQRLKHHPDADRQFVKVLGGVLDHGLDAVEAACAEALSAGIANGDVILAVLARQRQPPPVPSITTPHALRLKIEPVADCGRYDSLRKVA